MAKKNNISWHFFGGEFTGDWTINHSINHTSQIAKSSTTSLEGGLTPTVTSDNRKLDKQTNTSWTSALGLLWGARSSSASVTALRAAGNQTAHWANFAMTSSAMTGIMQMNSVCARRLAKLETFAGDEDLGFDKPSEEAVRSVRAILTKVYSSNPQLEPPAISPAQDGEIIISWRQAEKFMVLSFTEGSHFDWAFRKTKHKLYGTANANATGTGEALAQVLTYLFNDIWRNRKIEQNSWSNVKIESEQSVVNPQITAE